VTPTLAPTSWLRLLAPSLVLLTNGVALGQTADAQQRPCQEADSNAQMRQCLRAAAQKADAALDQTYEAIVWKLSGSNREALRAAQQLWIRFRDASCTAARNLYEGGTLAPAAYWGCMEAATRQRTAELKSIYGDFL
jgi:uncharacterized protein YecT (DUF1311 family)